jgi:ABC-type cobalamin/Fe3+-siderophores transport system ATPase subunit
MTGQHLISQPWSMKEKMSLLDIKNISYQAGAAKIIDDLSLSIEASEIHALLGTNGTGKSTLPISLSAAMGTGPHQEQSYLRDRTSMTGGSMRGRNSA